MKIVILFLVFVLAIRFFSFYSSIPKIGDTQKITIETTLFSEPKLKSNSQQIRIKKDSSTIFITTPRFPQFSYGDMLSITGNISEKKLDGGDRTILVMSYPAIEKKEPQGVLGVLSLFRSNVIALYEATLPPLYATLLLGIVFGIKGTFPASFDESLRLSGVYHVVAASGMNITMTASFLAGVLGFFLSRRKALFLVIVGIMVYAAMAGFSASIVRASIMGGLVAFSQILGKQYVGWYGVILAAFVMLFVDPSLIFDTGFQLSFAATLGLLYIRPLFMFSKKAKEIIEKSVLGDDLVTTTSAQFATVPILLGTFGSYSFSSLIINGLVLWTIPVLMLLGGIAGVIGVVIPFIGKIMLFLCLPFLWFFETVVTTFPQVGTLELNTIPWQFTVSYYCFLITFVILLYKLRR